MFIWGIHVNVEIVGYLIVRSIVPFLKNYLVAAHLYCCKDPTTYHKHLHTPNLTDLVCEVPPLSSYYPFSWEFLLWGMQK